MFRFASWFSSKSGRNFTRWCVGTAAFSIFGTQVAAAGPFMGKIKDIFQVYIHERPRPLAPEVKKLVKEVLHDSNLKEEQKKKLKFFYVVGHELFHLGGIGSPWGAIIGVPFPFENIEDVNFNEVRIVGKDTIDWVIDGHDLIKAMTMTDNAKKFALMREIYSCSYLDVFTNAIIGAGCFLLPANMAQKMNAKTNALERLTLGKRCVRYCFLYCVGFFLYRLLKDPLKHLSAQKADNLAAETGIDYLNGGIEYYEKLLLKNIALKELPESRFKNAFDEHGNESYFLFSPKMPTSRRLDLLRDMREKQIGKVENENK